MQEFSGFGLFDFFRQNTTKKFKKNTKISFIHTDNKISSLYSTKKDLD